MEITIKGKTINRIRTLHMTEYACKEDGIHLANFVIYDEYDTPDAEETTTHILYFKSEDLESIKLF